MKNVVKSIIVKLNLVKVLSLPLLIFRLFPVKNNRILFQNFTGKGYGDSPKYIADRLRKEEGKFDLYWVLKKNTKNDLPQGIKGVKLYSIRYFFILATSKIWISNSRFDQYVIKRKKQFYIQTWHSPLRLKKIEMDAVENLSQYYRKVMKNDSKMIDLMISGCDFSYNIYRNSFLYDGDILKIGTPRCDIFFDKEEISKNITKVFNYYNIDNSKKIILYAPTFRTKRSVRDYIMDYNKVVNGLGDDYILLVRLHPRMNIKIEEFDNVIDASKYPDMQELICATDYMITDYSSCCFDTMIANKPCILFLKDLEQYKMEERDLYFDIEKLPFYKSDNEDDIIKFLKKNDFKEYNANIKKFEEQINLYENGSATESIVEIIEGEMKK